jgi:wobble nucleotide-excising tRNase
MIESIHIADVATYGRTAEIMGGLSKINFIYGSNGSGKTTISKVIADEDDYSRCCVTWKGGTRLQPMVYNRDFVKRNFNETADLKGIFTLGEQNIDTLNKIATATNEKDQLTKDIEDLKKSLQGTDGAGGKIADLALVDSKFRDICWSQKQKYDPNFADAFEGLRNNKEKFRDRVLQELSSNSSTLEALTDLEKRAQTIFGSTPTSEAMIALLETNGLVAHESNSILNKRITGKDEVDIAAMISKLGNSDWVKEGRNFFAVNDNVCPFCQQHTPNSLAKAWRSISTKLLNKTAKQSVSWKPIIRQNPKELTSN